MHPAFLHEQSRRGGGELIAIGIAHLHRLEQVEIFRILVIHPDRRADLGALVIDQTRILEIDHTRIGTPPTRFLGRDDIGIAGDIASGEARIDHGDHFISGNLVKRLPGSGQSRCRDRTDDHSCRNCGPGHEQHAQQTHRGRTTARLRQRHLPLRGPLGQHIRMRCVHGHVLG